MRERGLYIDAIGGTDIALWDIVGKAVGLLYILPETSPIFPGAELPTAGNLAIGYGIGFAAVAGKGISDYAALELTGSWIPTWRAAS